MAEMTYHLIHANLAHARASLDDPIMKDFIDRVDEIDALAGGWPGFIAQPALPDEGEIYTEPYLLNVSIWESVDNLRDFTHDSKHEELLARRAEWFVQSERHTYVLFWMPAGILLTEREIQSRLTYLQRHGPTPYAFNFERPFTVQDMLDYPIR